MKSRNKDLDEGDVWFLGTITGTEHTGQDKDRWFTNLEVNGTAIRFRIDTRADITVISEHTYQSLP